MMITDPIGIYLHVPICVRKCNYCDFCSFPKESFSRRSEYVDALCSEIRSYKNRGLSVDSIFFGGGTPSLLSRAEITQISSALKDTFFFSTDTEFTLEANPLTLDEEKLLLFSGIGVNRLSLGLQSIHKKELKTLGRIHGYDDFLSVYHMARKMGIHNINVDLMYGIPEQTITSFVETLNTVLSLSPEHISVYGLILEEGTDFYRRRDALHFPSVDEECDMYYSACNLLNKFGYSHYEISNYAKPGFESRHNLKYWQRREYIGFGVSAHSYLDGFRFANSVGVDEYIDSVGRTHSLLTEDDLRIEYIMLSLRLSSGISLSEYYKLFGKDFLKDNQSFLDRLSGEGLVRIFEDAIALTERGFYVSNSIIAELI